VGSGGVECEELRIIYNGEIKKTIKGERPVHFHRADIDIQNVSHEALWENNLMSHNLDPRASSYLGDVEACMYREI
jgi:hypothetical protein